MTYLLFSRVRAMERRSSGQTVDRSYIVSAPCSPDADEKYRGT
jgi:hypothetical protein